MMGIVADLEASLYTFQESRKQIDCVEMTSNALNTIEHRRKGSNIQPWQERKDKKSSKKCFVCKHLVC